MATELVTDIFVHGLRHRPSGSLVRVHESSRVLQEEPYRNVETTYHMTLDPADPVYDAGSTAVLALALSSTSGATRERPLLDGLDPGDLEPVLLHEVLTRTVEPLALEMEVPLRVRILHVHDVDGWLKGQVPGLAEVADTVSSHGRDLRDQPYPGEDFEWGAFRLTGVVVPGTPEGLPEDLSGRVVEDGSRGSASRRALAAFPLEAGSRIASWGGEPDGPVSLVLCLSDARPLPHGLAAALRPAPAPAV